MLDKIKMRATPESTKQIQKIVFASGGSWINTDDQEIAENAPFLYLEDLTLSYGNDETSFNESEFDEVSPFAFIASRGMEAWLPEFEEIVYVSDEKIHWQKRKFRCYVPGHYSPFLDEKYHVWTYCIPYQKG